MSLFLHRLGRLIARHRIFVLVAWLLIVLALIGGGSLLGASYEDDFSVPGTESQVGQEVLTERFGTSASGASAQLLFQTTSGSIQDADTAAILSETIADIEAVDGVAGVSDIDRMQLNDDGDAALATVQFDDEKPSEDVLAAVHDAAVIDTAGVASTIGGAAYGGQGGEMSHASEIIGILVALMVLLVTFGSFLAAGMPIFAALLGVAGTSGALMIASNLTSISTATPSFAVMLGLAVAIDYSLFILSRHRQELAHGLTPTEAMARSLGTAGGAVVFAGLTVIVSLLGLSVVGIPVLTVMAVGGSLAVAMAVLVALTVLPAVALLFGERLRPGPRAGSRRAARRAARAAAKPARHTTRLTDRWIRVVTRVPALTIVLVVVGVGALAIPAAQMSLALPDASTKPVGTDQRDNFDAVADAFGPGWNAPLLITVDILESSQPVQTLDDLSAAFEEIPGVAAVAVATPNESGDTGLLRVIPEGGQNDQVTKDLVHDIRDRSSELEEEYGVSDIRVTGTTAINIDTSEKLSAALLPFTLTVVGLSLILLMIVFRSIWVPIKATLGFLLSVGAAFGAIVAVFQWGWFPALLGEASPGPLVSFLPILVMGVLFGLAMDYEMFLVSRMREDFSRSGDPDDAVRSGFRHSAPVVTAAAVIMISVFAAFVPGGSATIKPIAFGLAVGVFVDAFLVRMTLVPAVMSLLGARAWWMPGWLARILPSVDVEGEALTRQLALDDAGGPALAISARDLRTHEHGAVLTFDLRVGEIATLPADDGTDEVLLAHVLSGRTRALSGSLAVAGQVLPERAEAVRRVTAIAHADDIDPRGSVNDHLAQMIAVNGGSRRMRRERQDRAVRLLSSGEGRIGERVAVSDLDAMDRQEVAAVVALVCGANIVFLPGASRPQLADLLQAEGASVVRFRRTPRGTSPSPSTIGAHA
ncbi:MMPL family transporter [Microbacterium sediminicola]|uniref:MMPL family transporter n=1 Tax=Microbacterium sediminicola TaxID=415210 RepID=A0ABP4U6B8_9MICO